MGCLVSIKIWSPASWRAPSISSSLLRSLFFFPRSHQTVIHVFVFHRIQKVQVLLVFLRIPCSKVTHTDNQTWPSFCGFGISMLGIYKHLQCNKLTWKSFTLLTNCKILLKYAYFKKLVGYFFKGQHSCIVAVSK